jgi:hypothetical protein
MSTRSKATTSLADRFDNHIANVSAVQPILKEKISTAKNVMALCGHPPHDYPKLREVCTKLGTLHALESDEKLFEDEVAIMVAIADMKAKDVSDLALKARSLAYFVHKFRDWSHEFEHLNLDIQRIRDLIESVIRVAGQKLPFEKWEGETDAVAA